jgi:hypothetical protein
MRTMRAIPLVCLFIGSITLFTACAPASLAPTTGCTDKSGAEHFDCLSNATASNTRNPLRPQADVIRRSPPAQDKAKPEVRPHNEVKP